MKFATGLSRAAWIAAALSLAPALSHAAAAPECRRDYQVIFGGGRVKIAALDAEHVRFEMALNLPADVIRLTNASVPASVPPADKVYSLKVQGTFYKTNAWEFDRIWIQTPPIVGPDGTTPVAFTNGALTTNNGRMPLTFTPPVAGQPLVFEIRDPSPATGKEGRPDHAVAGKNLRSTRALNSFIISTSGGPTLGFYAPGTTIPGDFAGVFEQSMRLMEDVAARRCAPVT